MKLLFAAQNGRSSYPWLKDELVKSPLIDLAYCVLSTGGGPKTLLGGHWASGEGLVHLRHETLDCPTFITSWVAGPLFCPAPPSCWFDPYTRTRPPHPLPTPRKLTSAVRLLCGRTVQTLTLAPATTPTRPWLGQGHRH